MSKKCEWCECADPLYKYEGMELCKACLCEAVGDDTNELYKELYEKEKNDRAKSAL